MQMSVRIVWICLSAFLTFKKLFFIYVNEHTLLWPIYSHQWNSWHSNRITWYFNLSHVAFPLPSSIFSSVVRGRPKPTTFLPSHPHPQCSIETNGGWHPLICLRYSVTPRNKHYLRVCLESGKDLWGWEGVNLWRLC